MEHSYDTSQVLEQAAQWRLKADLADQPAMREYCLQQARRYEAIVRRSLEVPLFIEGTARGSAA